MIRIFYRTIFYDISQRIVLVVMRFFFDITGLNNVLYNYQ